MRALLIALLTAVPCAVWAQPLSCADHKVLLGQFEARYNERPVSAGLQANGALLEVLANPITTSWTIIATTPSGLTCILAHGIGWQIYPDVEPGDPS